MNALVEKGFMTEMPCGSNFSYVLSDNSAFLSTEYKVLQSQGKGCFVQCMKMLYNGKIQLFYMTKALKPFSSMLPTLDAESFLTIVTNLFADILDVKHNGFLSCQNIDVAFDKVFVDPATLKVSLVYVPVGQRLHDEYAIFENEIRTGLVKLISGISTLYSPKTMQLSANLSNGTLSMEDLHARIKGGGGNSIPVPPSDSLHIVALNAPVRFELVVNKDEYTIGRKADICDGVIDFNKMIGRAHCKILKHGTQYLLMDLQSANGTYINKMRLVPNQPAPIHNGDVIRLANSDFQVKLG